MREFTEKEIVEKVRKRLREFKARGEYGEIFVKIRRGKPMGFDTKYCEMADETVDVEVSKCPKT